MEQNASAGLPELKKTRDRRKQGVRPARAGAAPLSVGIEPMTLAGARAASVFLDETQLAAWRNAAPAG